MVADTNKRRLRPMFGRFKPVLKQVATLLRDGQLDAAAALLNDPELAQHREGRKLSRQLGERLLARAAAHLQADALHHAWDDLTLARRFAGNDPERTRLEQQLLSAIAQSARRELQRGRPDLALQLIDDFRRRGAESVALHALADLARNWQKARRLVQGGDLYAAVNLLRRIEPRSEEFSAVAQERARYEQQLTRVQKLEGELAQQLADQNWTEVLRLAAELLAELPAHSLALAARQRAWEALGGGGDVASPPPAAPAADPVLPPHGRLTDQRCGLFVDGGGSYLVCVGDRVTLGNRSGRATVPLLANVSSVHAELVRDASGYVLVPHKPVSINGARVTRPVTLKDDIRIALIEGVEFRFRLPSPMCKTAVLEPLHTSYLDRRFDAILLLGRFCFVGEDRSCHVYAPDTPRHTLLVEQRSPLRFLLRGPGPIRVNNLLADGEASFPIPARIELPSVMLTILPHQE